AYLAPAESATKNIWTVAPTDPGSARQLTHSGSGVLSFDVSPDGGRVAFAEANATKGSDIKLLDLDSGESRLLANCGNGLCTNPVWRPDGSQIAFDRRAAAVSPIPGVPRDDSRVWLVDPSATPPRPRMLFPDPQVRAHYNPRWSPDGRWIAVSLPTGVSNGSAGVMLDDTETGTTQFFPTTGPAGAFTPDSASFFFPGLAVQDGAVRTVVERADLTTLKAEPI